MVGLFTSDLKRLLPSAVWTLAQECSNTGVEVYLTGGTVRDILLGRETKDIDLAVSLDALRLARWLAENSGGTFVLLDEAEKTARIAFESYHIDMTEFRKGSKTVEEDLQLRDLTINALAVPLTVVETDSPLPLIDPAGGMRDIEGKTIRFISEQSVLDDPLRMLRAYRFAATLGFDIDPRSREMAAKHGGRMATTSVERVMYELNALFAACPSYPSLRWMAEDGLLSVVSPELEDMRHVEQQGCHHLDVYEHSFLAFHCMEKIQIDTAADFSGKYQAHLNAYLRSGIKSVLLKWAALFHDIGKPKTAERVGEKTTFYNHDQVGTTLFSGFATRHKWPAKDMKFVARMISLHMRPFHLVNVMRSGEVTPRAVSRLVREAGDDLIGLFVLAMADSLAGSGPAKPPDCEQLLGELFDVAMGVYEKKVALARAQPRLVTGDDLIEIFHLEPGPRFRTLMEELEDARVEGVVQTRDEALSWLEGRLEGGGRRG